MIYDAYTEELQKQEKSKEKQKSSSLKKEEEKSQKKQMLTETQVNQLLLGPPEQVQVYTSYT